MISIRRLGPGDGALLRVLADDDIDFGLEEGTDPSTPLDALSAAAYLADPDVVHWIATDGGEIVGHLLCLVERRRHMPPRQLLLYDVGVRSGWRRRGVGRALLEVMTTWMGDEEVHEVWVVADGSDAIAFYEALGFAPANGDLSVMERRLEV